MKKMSRVALAVLAMGAAVLLEVLVLPPVAPAQEEVTSAITRYKEREVSTGYYEEYEAVPRRQRPLVGIPGVRRGLFPYSPSAAQVRVRTHLADSHQGLKFYEEQRCEYCHVSESFNHHSAQLNISCRQCHGGEPIASLNHYYSPLNPIRRHAYVCSKCHQGASASFASYVIHEPAPGALATKKTFPALYYAYWFMLWLLIVTLAFFIPHSLMVGVRELFGKKGKVEK